ncbi:MAG: aconitate hydratase B, partial [Candidatus Aminicenantes bacterium]
MLESYFQHVKEREALGIPPLPLTPEWTAEVCQLLENPPAGQEEMLLDLLKNRVAPGVDPASKVKAEWLTKIANKEKSSPIISPPEAVFLLGTMLGGYNVEPLISLLSSTDDEIRQAAIKALSQTILVYGAYDKVKELSQSNQAAATVLKAWAEAEWFKERPPFPEKLTCKVFRVDGEVNTDDLSPAKHAWSRPDIPLHALSMGETRFPGGIETIKKFRDEGYQVAFVADVVGTGSSRKSATNSLLWHIGQDIPYIPNKRRGGVVIGGLIAPIFF